MRAEKISLFVFIDALGWELAGRHSFLDDLLPVRAPMETIFGYSSTCHPTILTGTLPRTHRHFTFFYYNPKESPFRAYRVLGLLPSFITSRGRVRHKMSQLLQPLHGYTGYFALYNMPFRYLHLFDYAEKHDLYQPGGINGGVPTIFDALREKALPFSLPDWRLSDAARITILKTDIVQNHVPFAYLILGQLDGTLHAHGTQSPKTAENIRWYEKELRNLVVLAQEHYRDVRLFVFSDHGMTDTAATCDLMARINALGLKFGLHYAAVYDSTMARFWFLNPMARGAIVEALEQEPQGRILSEEQLAAWGCDFPGRQYGELFFLMNPGTLLCPSFMGERPLAAMHGYSPEDKDSVAAFMSNVPPPVMPKRLDAMYRLMLEENAAGASSTKAPSTSAGKGGNPQ